MTEPRVWRDPDEETDDLYPGLVVHDGRVSGSITAGKSRLPLWAFNSTALYSNWDEVEKGWSPTRYYGWTEDNHADFLYNLLETRGEFGRLLLVLANAEREERDREDAYLTEVAPGEAVINITPGTEIGDNMPAPWWLQDDLRQSVIDQLKRCLEVLEPTEQKEL